MKQNTPKYTTCKKSPKQKFWYKETEKEWIDAFERISDAETRRICSQLHSLLQIYMDGITTPHDKKGVAR